MENTPQTLVCNCSSLEHSIVVRKDYDDDREEDYFIEIHLAKKPFISRIKYAFLYLFGYQCAYGAFEEVIVNKERLKEFVNNL